MGVRISVELSRDRRIVKLDQKPLRRAAESECRRVMRSVARLREKVEHFERVVVPAYERWLEKTLGGLLAEQREIEARIASIEEIVADVASAQFWSGCTQQEAYAEVMRGRREEQAEQEGSWAHGEGTADDEAHDEEGRFSEEERLFRNFLRHFCGEDPDTMGRREYKKMFREFQHRERRWGDSGEESGRAFPPHRSAAQKNHSLQVKEIYRLLVRRLHPDSGADYNGESGRLWHELQEAYQSNDLERLEILLAVTEIHDNEGAPRASIFHIRQVTAEFLRTERGLQARLLKLRKTPAGRFDASKKPLDFAAALREKINKSLASGRDHLAHLESLLASWQAPRTPRRPRAKKSSRPESSNQSHFDFFS